jgi:hypothetical protein
MSVKMQVSQIRKSERKGYVILEPPAAAYVIGKGESVVVFSHGIGSEMPIGHVWNIFRTHLTGDELEDFRNHLAQFAGHEVNPLQKY